MAIFVSILFALAAAWMVWVPLQEYRHAQAAGKHRIPFSRMLMRLVSAGCMLAIGLMIFFSRFILPDKSKLYEITYWCFTLFFALMMLVAGCVDYFLAKIELLRGQKAILQELARPKTKENKPGHSRSRPNLPSQNGQDPST